MLHRRLALSVVLTIGDFLLWEWSVADNRYILALVAGLALVPLAIATLWLLAVGVARALTRTARAPGIRHDRRASAPEIPEPARVAAPEISAEEPPQAAPSSRLAA